jgi:hypothetical protein
MARVTAMSEQRRWDHLSDAELRHWIRSLHETAAITRRQAEVLERRADRLMQELAGRAITS